MYIYIYIYIYICTHGDPSELEVPTFAAFRVSLDRLNIEAERVTNIIPEESL